MKVMDTNCKGYPWTSVSITKGLRLKAEKYLSKSAI